MAAATRRFDTRDLARIAVFAAIIAALGLLAPIQVPGLVPITAQTLGVILAGMVLGPWRGAAAVLVFLALVFAGLPLLSGGHGGVSYFVGVTAGYLYGWVAGAWVTGAIAQSGRTLSWLRVALGGIIGGIGVVYLFGIPVQSLVTGIGIPETAFLSLAFLPGDLAKVTLATVLTLMLWRAYPPVFGDLRARQADRARSLSSQSAR